jgi:hypothetical protein
MVKCLICGKRIWFFQRKGYEVHEDFSINKKKVLIHKECYEKQLEEKE